MTVIVVLVILRVIVVWLILRVTMVLLILRVTMVLVINDDADNDITDNDCLLRRKRKI